MVTQRPAAAPQAAVPSSVNALAGGEFGYLDGDLLALREAVREFMRRDVLPAEDKVEHDAYELPPDLLAPLQDKAKRAGWWCLASPEWAGGSALPLTAQVVITEEASKCRMGAYHIACGAFGWDPPGIIFGGTPEQIERYAVPTVASGAKTFVAMTEPGGGADPARGIETTARRTDDGWLVNGTKIFISGADDAEWGILFARTDPTAGRRGISAFVVDKDVPGLSVRPIPVIRSWAPFEVHFDDVLLPPESLLGRAGEGFALAQKWLVHGRVPYAAGCVGIASAALELATKYAKDRQSFGSRLADKQAIQWMIADSDIELRAARALTYEAAAKADAGLDFKTEASIAKVFATETAGRVVDRCIQIFGGLGVSRELPLERWYREMRIKRIGEGPSEVHRMVLARQLLRD